MGAWYAINNVLALIALGTWDQIHRFKRKTPKQLPVEPPTSQSRSSQHHMSEHSLPHSSLRPSTHLNPPISPSTSPIPPSRSLTSSRQRLKHTNSEETTPASVSIQIELTQICGLFPFVDVLYQKSFDSELLDQDKLSILEAHKRGPCISIRLALFPGTFVYLLDYY